MTPKELAAALLDLRSGILHYGVVHDRYKETLKQAADILENQDAQILHLKQMLDYEKMRSYPPSVKPTKTTEGKDG